MSKIKYMRFFRCFFVILLLLSVSVSAQTRKKVGVVLSGGGAKGVAHIGALKVIEEAGIPIDYIVGTSMGALIGGLYSIGYTTDQLDTLVMSQDWNILLADKISREDQSFEKKENAEKYVLSVPFKHPNNLMSGGLMEGQNVTNLLSELTIGYHDSIDFRTLPIPFACVSENVVDGSEVVFNSGVLYSAMRSSMSIPGVFAPVKHNGMVLIDGGMVNNYPVDVAQKMGAEVIIGVDVDDTLMMAKDLNELSNVLFQISTIVCLSGKYPENVKNTDVYMRVNIDGYSAASFSLEAIDTLINRGYDAADKCRLQLAQLRDSIGIDSSYVTYREPYVAPLLDTVSFKLKEVILEGVDKKDVRKVMKRYDLYPQDDSLTTIKNIKRTIGLLNGTMAYSSVTYSLNRQPNENEYTLRFMMKERKYNSFNFGLRFDSEEFVAVALNSTFNVNTTIPSKFSISGRLGNRSSFRVDYSIMPRDNNSGVNFAYMFQYNDIDVNYQGRKSFNETFRNHMVEFSLYNIIFRKFKRTIGVRYESYDYNDFLAIDESSKLNKQNTGNFISYFLSLKYDSFNMRGFPSNGSLMSGEYSLCTDNGGTYDGGSPISMFRVNMQRVIPVSRRFSIIPALYGRVLFSTETPFPYMNAIGGLTSERYTPCQIPFVGVSRMEMSNFATSVFRVDFRQRMGGKHYLSIIGNMAYSNAHLKDMFEVDPDFGGGLSYGYDSVFGPLKATFGYSTITEKVGLYVDLGFYF